jgi:hypothetical protein
MKVVLGVIALIMGVAIFGWIGYEMSIKGLRALTVAVAPGVAMASAMCFCGLKWVNSTPAD